MSCIVAIVPLTVSMQTISSTTKITIVDSSSVIRKMDVAIGTYISLPSIVKGYRVFRNSIDSTNGEVCSHSRFRT